MTIDNRVVVNGVALPAPVTLDYSLEDIDKDSNRDVSNAKMRRNRIRSDVVKLSFTYTVNSLEEVTTVLNAIKSKTFDVEFYDYKEGKRVTKEMYAGAKTFRPIAVSGNWIQGFKFNLTEV